LAGCNSIVEQFAFSELARDECPGSIGLFASETTPALQYPAPRSTVQRGG
jgi:hypothetical protein